MVPEIQQYGIYIGENADFAKHEYDEYGRLKVIEIDQEGLLNRVNEYKNEIVNLRNSLSTQKEKYEKDIKEYEEELDEMDTRLSVAVHHKYATKKFSIDKLGYPSDVGAFSIEYPVMILVDNFVQACERCGFRDDYGTFLHYLINIKKFCYFYEPEPPAQELCRVCPTIESYQKGLFRFFRKDYTLNAVWFEFTDMAIEYIYDDLQNYPELIEMIRGREKYESAIQKAIERLESKKKII